MAVSDADVSPSRATCMMAAVAVTSLIRAMGPANNTLQRIPKEGINGARPCKHPASLRRIEPYAWA